jgi:hypothetical protein
MYNLDSFSYWKDPAVRINRIGIYPLDDQGKTQYYSKDSFVHHYLKRQIPQENLEFSVNDSEKEINEEQKDTISRKEQNNAITNLKNTITKNDKENRTIQQTEPNLEPIKLKHPINIQNKTISTSMQNNFNHRYNLLDKKKKLKLKKINDFQSKSVFKKRLFNNDLILGKTQNKILNKNKRNLAQSFDKKARLTGLQVFPNRKPKINPKLPLIMDQYRNENGNIINIIKTETKEMGENYNPYNFIVPHVNRTKRNIFGSLFHS